MKKLNFRTLFIFFLCCLAAFGVGRLYFQLTDGFRIAHITSDFTFDPSRETRALDESEVELVDRILSRPFTYYKKGCQSYVFLSEDGEYVLKFVKYQRFRPQFYNYWFSFIPPWNDYLQRSLVKKKYKMDGLLNSWKLVFNELTKESGLVYVHLNKTDHLNKKVLFIDKIGLRHTIDLDQMEFLIQKKVNMLCPILDQFMADGEEEKAKSLLTSLNALILSEYYSGIADNDYAFMQNTGVYNGEPVHIDVGQFVENDSMRDSDTYHQELFNKYYDFRLWLQDHYPTLLEHVDFELKQEIGEQFDTLKHIPKFR